MWKWIVGALLGLVVLVAALGYYAYHRFTKFASGGDSTSVVISASPSRVFASLANTDSLAVWMGAESMITASRSGPLVIGDTVHVERIGKRASLRALKLGGERTRSRPTAGTPAAHRHGESRGCDPARLAGADG